MSHSCTKLLKEWAIVCKALRDGRQIFLARKGGISEEEGEFVVENREFLLFPTYLHQSREQLLPKVHAELDRVQAEEPRDGRIYLDLFARVIDEIRVTRPSVFARLQGEHIWTDKVLEDRFAWGSEKGLSLLLIRVYRLPSPLAIPMLPKYGGCKSWVTPEVDITVPKGMSPVLSDGEFSHRRGHLLTLATE